MPKFHHLPQTQQRDILEEAASYLGIGARMIEKDYWVSWVLQVLFSNKELEPYLCFRGGTSLSKAFQCIHRFSEDIDIVLSTSFFPDITKEMLPHESESNSQRDRKQRNIRIFYRNMMKGLLLPLIEKALQSESISGAKLELLDLETARDPWVLNLYYPSSLAENKHAYVQPFVKIELSGRAQSAPSEKKRLDSQIAEIYPELGNSSEVTTLSPTRTFWEKAFILHEENLRDTPIRPRLARHYYDLAALIHHGYVDMSLFENVKQSRRLNYAYSWVNYETLVPTNMLLLPPKVAEKGSQL